MAQERNRFACPATDRDFADPLKSVDGPGWLGPDVRGLRILCLAAGGGKQGPLFAAAGAIVTVVDISSAMLEIDRQIARQRGLSVRLVETSMEDLSMFADQAFDVVIQPVSTCYVPDLTCVYREIARLLRTAGIYISQHKQPDSLRSSIQPGPHGYVTKIPRYHSTPLPDCPFSNLVRERGAKEFMHSWQQLVGEMCRSGFAIEDLLEPDLADPSAAPGTFGHRCCYIAPYVRIKARRTNDQIRANPAEFTCPAATMIQEASPVTTAGEAGLTKHLRRSAMKKADVVRELKQYRNAEKAAFFPRFFKTGPGEYGEGDRFLGVIVPHQRKIARAFRELPEAEIIKLLDDRYHECRLTGLLIMVQQYERGDERQKQAIVDLYLRKMDRVNNWDLVDSSAHKILGPHLEHRSRKLLTELSNSGELWKQRIAMMTTLHFIKRRDFVDTIRLARKYLKHEHDLIHKVTGWMLREMGKMDETALVDFLDQYAQQMPRTMLRYSLEKLPSQLRQKYLR